jgi:hypothetical protein
MYGLKIFDSFNNIILDATDTITRLRYTEIVPANTSGSVILDDIQGIDSCHFGIALEEWKLAHTVYRDNTEISWNPRSSMLDSSNTLIVVFLYT